MALVKVKAKYQITLPSIIRDEAGLDVGDVLDVKVSKGAITLTPKSPIERGISEGLRDIEEGREYGPYNTVEEAMHAFKKRTASAAKRRPPKP